MSEIKEIHYKPPLPPPPKRAGETLEADNSKKAATEQAKDTTANQLHENTKSEKLVENVQESRKLDDSEIVSEKVEEKTSSKQENLVETSEKDTKISESSEKPSTPTQKKSLGSQWEDRMRNDYSTATKQRQDHEDARVQGGKDFVGNQVAKLVSWIEKIGKDGKTTFGELFTATEHDMQTLSGTCKTARRLGIVEYDGEHLLQGRDDAVVISLTGKSLDKSQVVVSDKGKLEAVVEDPFAVDAAKKAVVECYRCGKPVLPVDRVGTTEGVNLHKACFECYLDNCTTQLTPSRFACIKIDGSLRFYCIPHYKSAFTVGADYEKGFVKDEK